VPDITNAQRALERFALVLNAPRLFRISSRATLPARFKGTFSFEEAHRLCCSWNSWHAAEDVACPEEDAPGCDLENL